MIRRVSTSISLIVLPACIWAQPRVQHDLTPPAVAPTGCEVTDDATVARLTEDITWLASDSLAGRAPGTPGGDGAAEYLTRSLTQLHLAEAGTEGFRQPFVVPYGVEATDATRITLSRGAETRSLSLGEALQANRETTAGEGRGEAVFVGHGCRALTVPWNDYAPAGALRGRIAVMLASLPQPADARLAGALRTQCAVSARVQSARSEGARAVVLIDDEETVRAPDYIPQVREGGPVVRISRAQGAWLLGREVAQMAAQTEVHAPAAAGSAIVQVALQPHRVETSNVVALVRGTSPTARGALVIGAHYDHLGHGGATSRSPESAEIHNGADDNGSGTTVILEVARRVIARPLTHDVVFVWFGAEELGLVGSQFFVTHRVPAATEIRAMLNLDMVGRLRACRLFVEGRESSDDLWSVVDGANAAYGFDARPWEASRGVWGASDHMIFQRAGIPVMFLFTGLHDDYHRPEDDVARLNLRGMGAIAGMAESLLRRADVGPAPVFHR